MRAARYLSDRIIRQIVKEDIDFCSWTDTGVRSTSYSGGFLSEHESGVRLLQDRIRALIPVANLASHRRPARSRASIGRWPDDRPIAAGLTGRRS